MPRRLLYKNETAEKLPSKLLEIRLRLKASQNEMLRLLKLDADYERDYVSKWERGVLVPPLHVLCAYADVANVYLDAIVRDSQELPLETPAKSKSDGLTPAK